MNLLLKTSEQSLISFSRAELLGLVAALNEVCGSDKISEIEFVARLGVERNFLSELRQKLLAAPPAPLRKYELVNVWAEPASLMVRAVTVHGDPVEMSTSEAEALVKQLEQAIQAAS